MDGVKSNCGLEELDCLKGREALIPYVKEGLINTYSNCRKDSKEAIRVFDLVSSGEKYSNNSCYAHLVSEILCGAVHFLDYRRVGLEVEKALEFFDFDDFRDYANILFFLMKEAYGANQTNLGVISNVEILERARIDWQNPQKSLEEVMGSLT